MKLLFAKPSQYDAMSGIYVGPSKKLEEDDNLGIGSLNIGASRNVSIIIIICSN